MGKKYGFHYKKGGVLTFDGIQLDGKKIKEIERADANGRTSVTVTFDDEDENEYKFDCIKQDKKISDIKEYWNGEPLFDDDENEE